MKLPAKFASKLLKVSDFSDSCDVPVCVHLPVCLYVCVCVCALLCVSAWQSGIDLTPHKEADGEGSLAWDKWPTPCAHRVCADCCWAFTDACNCSRSCGELKSTHSKANVTWNRLEIESQCRAALPPLAVPYQIYSVSCGLWLPPALWLRLVGVAVSGP